MVLLAALALGWAVPVPEHAAAHPARPAGPRDARPAVVVALVLPWSSAAASLGYAAYLLNVGRNAIGSIFSARSGHRAGRWPLQLPDDGRRRRGGPHGPPAGQPLGDQRRRQDRADGHHLRAPQPPERPVQRRIARCARSTRTATTAATNASSTPSTPRSTNKHTGPLPRRRRPGRAGHCSRRVSRHAGHQGPGLRAGGHGRLLQAHRRHGRHRIKAGGWVPDQRRDRRRGHGIHGMPDGLDSRRRPDAGRLPRALVRPLPRIRATTTPASSASSACSRPC